MGLPSGSPRQPSPSDSEFTVIFRRSLLPFPSQNPRRPRVIHRPLSSESAKILYIVLAIWKQMCPSFMFELRDTADDWRPPQINITCSRRVIVFNVDHPACVVPSHARLDDEFEDFAKGQQPLSVRNTSQALPVQPIPFDIDQTNPINRWKRSIHGNGRRTGGWWTRIEALLALSLTRCS
ncbi:hypothetical protein N658DRAFT_70366 [Parathielavia hyrcaniae]|uniref:Uncharacterized protein n=1 Tax=Parathielavia hyrcaniae TaxID=113614 RepID=A0AAN6Q0C6_9PEZI|nr:hypothetical protein N658DRAFT_70366 [Parathielavia hyrcaniae]